MGTYRMPHIEGNACVFISEDDVWLCHLAPEQHRYAVPHMRQLGLAGKTEALDLQYHVACSQHSCNPCCSRTCVRRTQSPP